jgi:hypothetical protein
MPADLTNLSEAEIRSLANQGETYRLLADVMQLNGAGVMIGDVMSGMARLGLRLVSVDDGDPGDNAQARLNAITDTQPCSCDCLWMRLTDAEGPGVGWWHRDDEHHFTRKCPDNGRKPRG